MCNFACLDEKIPDTRQDGILMSWRREVKLYPLYLEVKYGRWSDGTVIDTVGSTQPDD